MEHEERLKAALADRYQIEREIGSGGMATVYLAQDLKHDRKVAVKVLKPELAAVVGAERFLSEIRTTAHLQHPNILPLFDSGEADGQLFYVMPYVEGESLRDRLNRERQLPIDEAVRIGTEVAEALQAAHDDGIIHRDIKPANILLCKGKPLVADFGIALAVSAAGGGRLTETGLSLGTPYYMSPEQASADRDPDARSDVYSLGSVLYEMLTGEPPFPGSSAQAVLAKILTGDAERPTHHRRSIPPNVEGAVLRAIEKLPADRFASATEFASALSDQGFRWGGVATGGAVESHHWKATALGLACVGVVLVAVLGWALLKPEPPGTVEWFSLPYEIERYEAVPHMGLGGQAMLLEYPNEIDSTRLVLRRWDDPEATVVPGTEEALLMTLSPDARQVAFITDPGELFVVGVEGGIPQLLTDSGWASPFWARDGYVYYTDMDRGISRVPTDGSAPPQPVTEPEPDLGEHWLPSTSSGGDILFFTVRTRPARIDALRLSTGERKEDLAPGWKPQLTNTGHLVFATDDGTVMAAPFDEVTMEFEASPQPVVEDVHVTGNEWAAFFVADDGTLLYVRSEGTQRLEFVWMDRQGNASPVEEGWSFDPGHWRPTWDLSPDGERIAYRKVTDERTDIWIRTLSTGQEDRLTDDDALEGHIAWTRGGEEIVYSSDRGSPETGWIQRADFTGEARELLTVPGLFLGSTVWSPDGQWLLIRTGEYEGSRDILALQLGVDSLPRPLMASPYDETAPAISPDGRWLAFVSDRSGHQEVYLRPFPDGESGDVGVSVDGGRGPVWSPDGTELFFEGTGGTDWGRRDYFVATIDPDPTLRPPLIRRMFTVPEGFRSYWTYTLYDIHPDGERFLMARNVEVENQRRRAIIVAKNWTRLLTEMEWH